MLQIKGAQDWKSGHRVDYFSLRNNKGEEVASVHGSILAREVAVALALFSSFDRSKKSKIEIIGPCDDGYFHIVKDGVQIAAGTKDNAEMLCTTLQASLFRDDLAGLAVALKFRVAEAEKLSEQLSESNNKLLRKLAELQMVSEENEKLKGELADLRRRLKFTEIDIREATILE